MKEMAAGACEYTKDYGWNNHFNCVFIFAWLQKPDGIMLPDKAQLHVCGIEDRQYKEDKIFCK